MTVYDRLRESLERFIEASFGQRVDRCALYPGRVVSQAASGELEVQLDDQRWPTLTRVPLRFFVPGATLKVAAGARVLLGWEEADPRKPYAALWDTGTYTELAIGSHFAALADLVDDRFAQVRTAINALTLPVSGVTAGPPSPPPLPVPLASVAATKVKID